MSLESLKGVKQFIATLEAQRPYSEAGEAIGGWKYKDGKAGGGDEDGDRVWERVGEKGGSLEVRSPIGGVYQFTKTTPLEGGRTRSEVAFLIDGVMLHTNGTDTAHGVRAGSLIEGMFVDIPKASSSPRHQGS